MSPIQFHDLETPRLRLKSINMEDKEFVQALFSDPRVTRHLYFQHPSLPDEVERYIRLLTSEPQTRHRWILMRRDNGVKIGACGFYHWDTATRTAKLVFDLLPDFRGRGFMNEALRAVLAFARGEMSMKRIYSNLFLHNPDSIAVVEKLGFRRDRVENIAYQGEEYPHLVYQLDLE